MTASTSVHSPYEVAFVPQIQGWHRIDLLAPRPWQIPASGELEVLVKLIYDSRTRALVDWSHGPYTRDGLIGEIQRAYPRLHLNDAMAIERLADSIHDARCEVSYYEGRERAREEAAQELFR